MGEGDSIAMTSIVHRGEWRNGYGGAGKRKIIGGVNKIHTKEQKIKNLNKKNQVFLYPIYPIGFYGIHTLSLNLALAVSYFRHF